MRRLASSATFYDVKDDYQTFNVDKKNIVASGRHLLTMEPHEARQHFAGQMTELFTHILASVERGEVSGEQCAICLDTMQRPVMLRCAHIFCWECVMQVLESRIQQGGRAPCPSCRAIFVQDDVIQLIRPAIMAPPTEAVAEQPLTGDETSLSEAKRAVSSSKYVPTKIHHLIALMQQILSAEPTAKFVIFSNFSPMIETLRSELEKQRMQHIVIDGSVPLDKRAKNVKAFQLPGGPVACILSSRTGNAGLTLTAANHLIFMEPNMNIAVDDQAMGRVNRMGQVRPVTVHRLIAEGTVESKILRMIQDGTLSMRGYERFVAANATEKDVVLNQLEYLFQ
jgi:SNF2 family DNA or RNA helicase